MARVPASQRKRYLQERRALILDAAVRVFGRKGFERTRISDIAHTARVAVGTVYLYYGSKADIWDAAITTRVRLPAGIATATWTHLPLEQALTRFATTYLEFVDVQFPLFRMVLVNAQAASDADLIRSRIFRRSQRLVARLLVDADQRGELNLRGEPTTAAGALLGMLTTHALLNAGRGHKHSRTTGRQKWVAQMVRLFLDGVGRRGLML